MRTLRLVQEATDTPDVHRVEIALEEGGMRRTATARVGLVLSSDDRERIRWYLEDYLEYPIGPAPKVAAEVEQRLVELGRELFRAVFEASREAMRLWDRAEPELDSTRVEIVTDAGGAVAIPWELLRDPMTNTPLALRARSFVRTHSDPARLLEPPQAEAGIIRILLVICRPVGRMDVPFRSVASHLVRRSADARAAFELDVLRPPTFARLGQVLRNARDRGQPYHVLHFDGHGIWADLDEETPPGGHVSMLNSVRYGDPRTGAHGYLVFEDPSHPDNLRPVDGPSLGDLMVQNHVPVLVLNACRSAHADLATAPNEAPSDATGDAHARVRAYGSLAQEVIDAGVVGVVAMRYSVYVVTAAQFVGELYASLLAGHQLGEAVTRGRLHLFEEPNREVALRPTPLQDWIVPVVYENVDVAVLPTPTDRVPEIKVDGAATEPAQHPTGGDGLPRPPELGFFGRDDTLLALDRAFDARQVVLLHGYAGAGKTSTAAEFARWYQLTGGLSFELTDEQGRRVVDGPVLFSPFTRYLPLPRVLDQIGEVFAPMLKSSGVPWFALDDSQRREVALQLLEHVPVLWIWDNVEPVEGFPAGTTSLWSQEEQDELRDFLHDLRRTLAKVLLTSRRDESRWLGDLPRRVPILQMPMAERVQLAKAITEDRGRRFADVKDWRPLLEFTQGNPLTIAVLVKQALAENLHTEEEITAFVERLKSGRGGIEEGAAQGRTSSLSASLGYGFEHAFTQEERTMLAPLCLFQEFVLTESFAQLGESDLPQLRGLTSTKAAELLERAAEIGLLNKVTNIGYEIHPALPWYFRQLFEAAFGLPESEPAIAALHAYVETVAVVSSVLTSAHGEGQNTFFYLAVEEANMLNAFRIALARSWWDELFGMMGGLASLYRHTGQITQWTRLVGQVTAKLADPATDGPLPGLKDEWVSLTHYRVMLAEGARDFALAEKLQRLALTLQRNGAAEALTLPPEQLDEEQWNRVRSVAISEELLASMLRGQQKAECLEHYKESLRLCERIGARHEASLTAYNLAIAYLETPGVKDLDQCEYWNRRGLELTDSGDRLGQARFQRELGNVSYERFVEAREAGVGREAVVRHITAAAEAYHEALALAPPDARHSLAVTHGRLGKIYALIGRLDLAIQHYQRAIQYNETGGDVYLAAVNRHNLAGDLYLAGRYEEARLYEQASLAQMVQLGPGAAPDIAKGELLLDMIEQAIAARQAESPGGHA
jgi:hypothetical protein